MENIDKCILLKNFPMLRLLFLIFCFSLSISSNCQEIEIRILKQIDSLRKSKIDTILLYSLPCAVDMVLIRDPCYVDEEQYLFFIKNDSCFLKRFDNCKIYQTVLLDTNPLSFYFKNKTIIDKEKIKPPTYFTTEKGKRIKIISAVDHTCFYEMTIFLNNKKIFKQTNDYDLDSKMADEGKKNIYYNRNRKTKFKAFLDRLLSTIKQLKETSKFVQENSN
jgi:hypothetical protein